MSFKTNFKDNFSFKVLLGCMVFSLVFLPFSTTAQAQNFNDDSQFNEGEQPLGELPDGVTEGEDSLAELGDSEFSPGEQPLGEAPAEGTDLVEGEQPTEGIIDVGDLPDGVTEGEGSLAELADSQFVPGEQPLGEAPAEGTDLVEGEQPEEGIIDVGDLPDGATEGEGSLAELADSQFVPGEQPLGEAPAEGTDLVEGEQPAEGIIDVGDLPDGAIPEGETFVEGDSIPDGETLAEGEQPTEGIIDVGDLPDGFTEEGELLESEGLVDGEALAENEIQKEEGSSDLAELLGGDKEAIILPEAEMRELQKAMAEMARDPEQAQVYREMAGVLSTEFALVVEPEATPTGDIAATSTQEFNGNLEGPMGPAGPEGPLPDISTEAGKQQALAEFGEHSDEMLAAGMSEDDMAKMQAAIASGDLEGMESMMQEMGPMPGMDGPMPGEAMMEGGGHFEGPMVMEMDHFFQGVQMESMAMEMEARGMDPDTVAGIVDQGLGMIAQGQGQEAFGEVMEMAKAAFMEQNGAPGLGGPQGHDGPGMPDISTEEGQQMAMQEFSARQGDMLAAGMSEDDMAKMQAAIASGDMAGMEALMGEMGPMPGMDGPMGPMGPGGPGDLAFNDGGFGNTGPGDFNFGDPSQFGDFDPAAGGFDPNGFEGPNGPGDFQPGDHDGFFNDDFEPKDYDNPNEFSNTPPPNITTFADALATAQQCASAFGSHNSNDLITVSTSGNSQPSDVQMQFNYNTINTYLQDVIDANVAQDNARLQAICDKAQHNADVQAKCATLGQ